MILNISCVCVFFIATCASNSESVIALGYSDSPTDQTFHHFMTLLPILTFTELRVVSMEHLHRVWHASRERVLHQTPGIVPFGICNVLLLRQQTIIHYTTFHDLFPDLTSYRLSLIWQHRSMTLSLIWLLTEFNINEYRFPWDICNWCGMLTGDAYPSGHLVPSHLLGNAYAPIVERKRKRSDSVLWQKPLHPQNNPKSNVTT